jgi:apoptosis-resistant E3 ubiquitin protein ligase 1
MSTGNLSNEFQDKRTFFVKQLSELRSEVSTTRIIIRRGRLLEDAFQQLKGLSETKWRGLWEVTFVDEYGIDLGGLRREFLNLLTLTLFTPGGGAPPIIGEPSSATRSSSSSSNASLRSVSSSSSSSSSSSVSQREAPSLFKYFCAESDAVHPNEQCTKRGEWFEFAGKVFAKCLWDTALRDPTLINVRFTGAFLKQILDLPVDSSDFARDDKEFFKSKV